MIKPPLLNQLTSQSNSVIPLIKPRDEALKRQPTRCNQTGQSLHRSCQLTPVVSPKKLMQRATERAGNRQR
ncbi:hypothetical protein [Prochlorococcus sp. MIT 1306]|uniref:hypothetical protein n=1 Tax=Prochlorococcus sp. MIT 1306 TaxID=1799667 RepID=UPI0018D40CF2|nr:hypothetical protein [Prochlorococcus sp. MIT 1306]